MSGDTARQGLMRRDRRSFAGIPIVIEYRKGDIRTGKGANGRAWSCKMKSAYGRVVNSKGLDGDPLDVYVGPNPHAMTVFTVDQLKGPEYKELDEQKHMLGYDSLAEAKEAYLENYPDNRILGGIKAVPMAKFLKYVKGSKVADPVKLARWRQAVEKGQIATVRQSVIHPSENKLNQLLLDVRKEGPSKVKNIVDDGLRKIHSAREDRKRKKRAKMTTKLSTLDELNLARVSAGLEPVKVAKDESRAGEVSGQLAGIPIGTAAGLLASRLAKKTKVGPMPLAPFAGMTAGPVIGGEIGKQVDKGRSKKAGVLLKAVRGAGKLVDDGLRAAGPKNIAKAGILAAGAGTVYGGYKGVGAAKRLAQRPQHGFSTPRHRSLGRAF